MILDALKFVRGSVAKKDFVPSLTHFQISGGMVRGFNGAISLCGPIALDADVTPNALMFIKAVEACSGSDPGVTKITIETGSLVIQSGGFRAVVECTTEPFPKIFPSGAFIEWNGKLLDAIKTLEPFIATDASRPWANGILFRGESAFATNNIVLAEYWIGVRFPVSLNIPRVAVQEMLRIGEEPERIQCDEQSVTFHYPGNRWLRAQTVPTDWPDVGGLLSNNMDDPRILPEDIFDALERLKPFVGGMGEVHFSPGQVSTDATKTKGATVDAHVADEGVYNLAQLLLLRGIAKKADFTRYPSPVTFYGDNIRGVIVGLRS